MALVEAGEIGTLPMSVVRLVIQEDGEERSLELDRDVISIGRTSDNAIPVKDALSSRHHCEIVRGPEGYVLSDLGSRNGTLLNGEPVKRQVLVVGDQVAIGETIIHFGEKLSGAADEVSTPPREEKPVRKASSRARRPGSGRSSARVRPRTGDQGGDSADVVTAERAVSAEASPGPGQGGSLSSKQRWVLRGIDGEVKGRSFELREFPFTMGRAMGCKLQLKEDRVSNEHAMLVEDDGAIFLVDLGSSNGTMLDGDSVVRAEVDHGAVIGVGSSQLRFQDRSKAFGSVGEKKPEPPAAKDAGQAAAVDGQAEPAQDEPATEAKEKRSASARSKRGSARRRRASSAEREQASLPAAASERTDSARKARQGAEARNGDAAGGWASSDTEFQDPEISALDASVEAAAVSQGRRVQLVSGIALGMSVILFVFFGLSSLRDLLRFEEMEPNPDSNLIENWSFELAATPTTPVPGWSAGPEVTVDQGIAKGGIHSLRLTSAAGQVVRCESSVLIGVLPDHDYSVRAWVRREGGGAEDAPGLAGLSVSWLDSNEQVIHEMLAWSTRHSDEAGWGEVRASFVRPPGARSARLACVVFADAVGGSQAWFDRVRLVEVKHDESATIALAGGGGLAARCRDAGAISLSRDGAPLVEWLEPFDAFPALVDPNDESQNLEVDADLVAWSACLGPGRLASAWMLERPSSEGVGIRFGADLVVFDSKVDEGPAIQRRVVGKLQQTSDGLDVSFLTSGVGRYDPVGLLAIVEPRRNAQPCELLLHDGRIVPLALGGPLVSGVVEMTWGEGEDTVTFVYHGPASISIQEGVDRRLRVYQVMRPRRLSGDEAGADPRVGFSLMRSSNRALARVARLLESADQARLGGGLGRAREDYSSIIADTAATDDERDRAQATRDAIDRQFDAMLSELESMREDVSELANSRVALAAERVVETLRKQEAPSRWLRRAEEQLEKLRSASHQVDRGSRDSRAAELLSQARQHQSQQRLALARSCLQLCLRLATPGGDIATEAQQKLEFIRGIMVEGEH